MGDNLCTVFKGLLHALLPLSFGPYSDEAQILRGRDGPHLQLMPPRLQCDVTTHLPLPPGARQGLRVTLDKLAPPQPLPLCTPLGTRRQSWKQPPGFSDPATHVLLLPSPSSRSLMPLPRPGLPLSPLKQGSGPSTGAPAAASGSWEPGGPGSPNKQSSSWTDMGPDHLSSPHSAQGRSTGGTGNIWQEPGWPELLPLASQALPAFII